MRITLLCNAGLAIECEDGLLLVDVPNCSLEPFAALPEEEWQRILSREIPYDRVKGIWITHDHPDHCNKKKLEQFRARWPDIPVFMPEEHSKSGTVVMGAFVISYEQLEHAPMDVPTPPHVVSWIRAEGKSIYVAADAKLDVEAHRRFLKGRVADCAFWNSMYLSKEETRALLRHAAAKNCIYHMPPQEPDSAGIWRKCRSNLRRYGNELETVQVLSKYPETIEL